MLETFLTTISNIIKSDITKIILFNPVLTIFFMENPPLLQLLKERTDIYDNTITEIQILNKFVNYETIMAKSKRVIVASYPCIYLSLVTMVLTGFIVHYKNKYLILTLVLFYYKLYLYLKELYGYEDSSNITGILMAIILYTGIAFNNVVALMPTEFLIVCGIIIMIINKLVTYNELEKQTGIQFGLFPRLFPIASSLSIGNKIIRKLKVRRK